MRNEILAINVELLKRRHFFDIIDNVGQKVKEFPFNYGGCASSLLYLFHNDQKESCAQGKCRV